MKKGLSNMSLLSWKLAKGSKRALVRFIHDPGQVELRSSLYWCDIRHPINGAARVFLSTHVPVQFSTNICVFAWEIRVARIGATAVPVVVPGYCVGLRFGLENSVVLLLRLQKYLPIL